MLLAEAYLGNHPPMIYLLFSNLTYNRSISIIKAIAINSLIYR